MFIANEKRKLGKSQVEVIQLGFGSAPLGDLYAKLLEEEAISTVDTAYSGGIRLFDTSPYYGHGLSEHRVGHVLRQKPREYFILSTKVGRTLKPQEPSQINRGLWFNTLPFEAVYDYSYDGVMRQVEDSLQRLATNRIDILLIHNVDSVEFGDKAELDRRFSEAMSGAYRALEKLRAEGTVKAIGCGLDDWKGCLRFAEAGDFDCFLLAGRYTLLEQESLDEFLPLCEQRNIGILLGGVYNSGILATGVTEDAKYEYEKASPEIVKKVRLLESVCKHYNVPLAAVAIQFPLAHSAVSSVVIGAVTPDEVKQNIDLMSVNIPLDLWQELKDSGLLHENAPTPA
ncbi:MAG: aldo/keto reductase [Pleurocapsa sp. MO_226.B13]|nr:aldo/keto reductase [Pleurocapsa sp. MO_226.B13]